MYNRNLFDNLKMKGILMKKTVMLLALAIPLLFSCSAVKDLSSYEVDMDNDKAKIEDIFDSYTYVMLETADRAILTDVRKVDVSDRYISVLDKNRVVVFDRSGKYVSRVDAYGRGHGEYVSLDDYAIHDTCVYVLSRMQKAINVYGLSGKFVKSLKLDDWYSHIVFCGDNTIILSSENANDSKRNFLVYDVAKGRKIKSLDPFGKNENMLLGDYTPFCGRSEGGYYVTHPFSHDIYEIDADGIKPCMALSFADKGKLPQGAEAMSYAQLVEATTHKSVVKSLGLYCRLPGCSFVTFDMFGKVGGMVPYVCRIDSGGLCRVASIGDEYSAMFPYITKPMAVYGDCFVSACPAEVILGIEKYYKLSKFSKLGLAKESNYVVFFNRLKH